MMTKNIKKRIIGVVFILLLVLMIDILHNVFSKDVLRAVFSVRKMEKGGDAFVSKITFYEQNIETRAIYGDNPAVIEKIQNLKLKNHIFNYQNESSSNYIAVEYYTTDRDGQLIFSDTLYIYDNGFYHDIVAEPFPIWERRVDLYPFIKEILEKE